MLLSFEVMAVLDFHTAQYRYEGDHRLDISRKGSDPFGIHFAPPWTLVRSYRSGSISIPDYTTLYYRQLRALYKDHPQVFASLLDRDRAVLVCFERPEDGFCHRFILANVLEKMGAHYGGELNVDGTPWGVPDLQRFDDPTRRAKKSSAP